MKYGEILLLGKCNCKCFYCLSNEMNKLKQDNENQLNIHFSIWKNFNKYINILKENNIDKIFISSVVSEPMMYKYLDELIDLLKENGFKVGIRTNGYFALEKFNLLLKLDEEISFSLNSLNDYTCNKICGNKSPNFYEILNKLSDYNKKCRISIVINKYNEFEIMSIIKYLSKFNCVSYIQLRKVYKYNDSDYSFDDVSFNNVKGYIINNFEKVDNYFESDIYDIYGVKVSLWNNVFSKKSIQSYNYFTNGDISTSNLLVPAYENKEDCINE